MKSYDELTRQAEHEGWRDENGTELLRFLEGR
jgi:hypothetical protein